MVFVIGSTIPIFVALKGIQYILPLFANTAPTYFPDPVIPDIEVLSIVLFIGSIIPTSFALKGEQYIFPFGAKQDPTYL